MLTRRHLFTRGLAEVLDGASRAAAAVGNTVAPPGRAERSPPAPRVAFLRPPGALPEREFLAACTRCDACLIACPKESIRRAGHELGGANEGTPVILAQEQPCWLCTDVPCIAVCEPGALAPLPTPADARMGSLLVDDAACYSALGSPCDVCVERCPVRPKPIAVERGQGPVVQDACTGCAVCVWLCPADALSVVGAGR